jgi:TolB protein
MDPTKRKSSAGLATLLGCALLLLAAQSRLRGQAESASIGLFDSHTDIGVILHPGSAAYDSASNAYTIAGSGTNLWANVDAFQFVWKKMSGDVALAADISFIGESGEPHRKAELMIRQDLDPDSAYVDIARHGSGLIALQYRLAKGATTGEVIVTNSAPQRLQLAKRGDDFYLMFSAGAEDLHPSGGAIRVHLQEPFYVGLGVCAHDADATEKALFSNVELTTPAPVAATPALFGALETISIASPEATREVSYIVPGRIEGPNWTPDGNALLFNKDGRLLRVPVAGGTPQPMDTSSAARPNDDHRVSPDGKYIYFNSDRSGSMQIWRMLADGSATEQLIKDDFSNWNPHISPDGKWMVFLSYEKSVAGQPESAEAMLRVMSLADGKIKVLAKLLAGPGTISVPCWSPDSKRVSFVSYELIP